MRQEGYSYRYFTPVLRGEERLNLLPFQCILVMKHEYVVIMKVGECMYMMLLFRCRSVYFRTKTID
jgi:hypothetical protein